MALDNTDLKVMERIATALEKLVELETENRKHWYRIVDSLDAIENAIIASA